MRRRSDQPNMFGDEGGAGPYGPVPFQPSSPTSRAAAESVEPTAETLRRLVFDHVAGLGDRGATCDEIEEALGLRHQTASARVWELHKAGQIADSGETRRTRSGRAAVVWVRPKGVSQ